MSSNKRGKTTQNSLVVLEQSIITLDTLCITHHNACWQEYELHLCWLKASLAAAKKKLFKDDSTSNKENISSENFPNRNNSKKLQEKLAVPLQDISSVTINKGQNTERISKNDEHGHLSPYKAVPPAVSEVSSRSTFEASNTEAIESIVPEDMKVAELKAELKKRGVAFTSKLKKCDLVNLLVDALAEDRNEWPQPDTASKHIHVVSSMKRGLAEKGSLCEDEEENKKPKLFSSLEEARSRILGGQELCDPIVPEAPVEQQQQQDAEPLSSEQSHGDSCTRENQEAFDTANPARKSEDTSAENLVCTTSAPNAPEENVDYPAVLEDCIESVSSAEPMSVDLPVPENNSTGTQDSSALVDLTEDSPNSKIRPSEETQLESDEQGVGLDSRRSNSGEIYFERSICIMAGESWLNKKLSSGSELETHDEENQINAPLSSERLMDEPKDMTPAKTITEEEFFDAREVLSPEDKRVSLDEHFVLAQEEFEEPAVLSSPTDEIPAFQATSKESEPNVAMLTDFIPAEAKSPKDLVSRKSDLNSCDEPLQAANEEHLPPVCGDDLCSPMTSDHTQMDLGPLQNFPAISGISDASDLPDSTEVVLTNPEAAPDMESCVSSIEDSSQEDAVNKEEEIQCNHVASSPSKDGTTTEIEDVPASEIKENKVLSQELTSASSCVEGNESIVPELVQVLGPALTSASSCVEGYDSIVPEQVLSPELTSASSCVEGNESIVPELAQELSEPSRAEKLSRVKNMVEIFNASTSGSLKKDVGHSPTKPPVKKIGGLDALLAKKNIPIIQPASKIGLYREKSSVEGVPWKPLKRAEMIGSLVTESHSEQQISDSLLDRVRAQSSAQKAPLADRDASQGDSCCSDPPCQNPLDSVPEPPNSIASPPKLHSAPLACLQTPHAPNLFKVTDLSMTAGSNPIREEPSSLLKMYMEIRQQASDASAQTPVTTQCAPSICTEKKEPLLLASASSVRSDDRNSISLEDKDISNEEKEQDKNARVPEKRPLLNLVGGLHSLVSILPKNLKSENQGPHSKKPKVLAKVGALEKAKEAKRVADMKEEERQRRKDDLQKIREDKQVPSNPSSVPSNVVKKQLLPTQQSSKPLLSVPSKPAAIEPDASENGSTHQDPDTVRKTIEQTIQDKRKIMAEQRKERELKQKIRLAEIRAEQEQRKKEMEEKQKIETTRMEEMKKKKEEEDALKRAQEAAKKSQSQHKDLNILSSNQARAAEQSKNADKNEVQIESYELSDREGEDSDEGSDEEAERRRMKAIPLWAKGTELKELLCRQFTELIDPDSIFHEVSTCDLTEIFKEANPKKKAKYKDRKSSGNWEQDTLTFVEKMGYRRDMGFNS